MRTDTRKTQSIQEVLFTQALALSPGEYFPIKGPKDKSFDYFRSQIFQLFQEFPYRNSLKIKSFPTSHKVHIMRKAEITLGSIGTPRSSPTHKVKASNKILDASSYLQSSKITPENIDAIAYRNAMDAAPESIHSILKPLLGLSLEQAQEQLGWTITSTSNIHAFFLYLLITKPWDESRPLGENNSAQEKGKPTSKSSYYEQVLGLKEETGGDD